MFKNTLKTSIYLALSGLLFSGSAAADVVTQQSVQAPKNFVSDNSSSDFVVNKDTVTNTKYGLVWKRCFVGQTFKDNKCTGTPTEFATWGAALGAVSPQEQADGWRVPNIKELMHITDNTKAYPAVDKTVFTFSNALAFNEDDGWRGGFKQGTAPYVWSSTPVRNKTTRAVNWNPILKTESISLTAAEAKTFSQSYALGLAYGMPKKVYRNGKYRCAPENSNCSLDTDKVEKARYVLLVKTAL